MKINYRYHVLFWSCYASWDLLQEVSSNVLAMKTISFYSFIQGLSSVILGLPVKMILFYWLYRTVLKPAVGKEQGLVRTILIFIFSIVAATLLQRSMMYYIIVRHIYAIDNSKFPFFNFSSLVIILSDTLIPALLLLIIELYRYSKMTRERQAKLEKEKLVSELKFLKGQVNPHFLFNSLSTIHAMTQHIAPDAADMVVRLSALLRFMLYESAEPLIPISREIKLIEDYVELQDMRFGEKVKIIFQKNIDNPAEPIAPMLLFPFIENAFKHGVGESRNLSFVTIDLALLHGKLKFDVSNSFEGMHYTYKKDGIGLANVKRQLELLYPDHRLNILESGNTYTVNLSMNISADEKISLPRH